MWQLLLLSYVVALKVFKKTAPNGKLTVYLSKRDFVDRLTHVETIDGVVVVDDDYLKGRKVFGQVTTTFRYGREEDEVMGLKFSKELVVTQQQICPFPDKQVQHLTQIQERLIRRLGSNAFPFTFELPQNSPCSVTLQPGGGDYDGKPLGVQYQLKTYVGENFERRPHKRNSVGMAIRKIQFAPLDENIRQPHTSVSKGFSLSPGKVELQVTLERELFYHGDILAVSVTIFNHSKKTVRYIQAGIIQTCELTMINSQYSREIANIETKEGCPVQPDSKLNTVFYLSPSASKNRDRRGIALDGRVHDGDTHLASSTIFPVGNNPNDAVGIIVSYMVRVKVNLGTLGGDLVADLPFKLMHPEPEKNELVNKGLLQSVVAAHQKRSGFKSHKSVQQSVDIVFEDFAKWRQSIDEE